VIVYEALYPDATRPSRATTGSAGYDLFAYVRGREVEHRAPKNQVATRAAIHDPIGDRWSTTLLPGWSALIPLGFKAQLDVATVALVCPRSGLARKHRVTVTNAPGVIDGDYPGEWFVQLENRSRAPFEVIHGAAIAQAVIVDCWGPEWVDGAVGQTTDRVGGHGSTNR
jgi:dUTP pyrophosphatase